MVQTVIFDLDGTILDTIADLADAGNAVCRQHGWPEHTLMEFKAMVGHGISNLVTSFTPERFQSPLLAASTLAQFMDCYGRRCMEKTVPYPGVPELLARLHGAGVQLAVCSNKADVLTRKIVEHYYPGVFQMVRGKLEGVPVKPDPAAVRPLLDALGAEPDRTLFVGDSRVDVETGHGVGLRVCGVTWGFRSRQSLEEAGADLLADTVEELEHALFPEGAPWC